LETTFVEFFQDFNQFDWIVLGVVTVSALYGLSRGFAREVTSFLGWTGAFLLANVLALPVSETMSDIISDRSIRYVTAWGGVFVAVLFLFSRVGRWLSNQLRQPGLNFGNRLLGACFGAARGVIIAAALTLLVRGLIPDSEATLLNESFVIDDLEIVSEWLADNFDDVLNGDVPDVVDETIKESSML
jgi:membrane protein required for colicin V production